MQFHAMGHTDGPAYSPVGANQQEGSDMIDVSRHARRLIVTASVLMEAEAFGVLVTRRPDANVTSLSSYESSRLLDVLVHMKEALPRCEDSGCDFQIWTISSDARDAKARCHWVSLEKGADGRYRLSMSDA